MCPPPSRCANDATSHFYRCACSSDYDATGTQTGRLAGHVETCRLREPKREGSSYSFWAFWLFWPLIFALLIGVAALLIIGGLVGFYFLFRKRAEDSVPK